MTIHLPYWLAAIHLPVMPKNIIEWLKHFSSIEKLFLATNDELFAAGIPIEHFDAIKSMDWHHIDKELAWQGPNKEIISIEDPNYPPLLKETFSPPLVLYIAGNGSALSTLQLAVVGSRHPTPLGLQHAEQFASHLSQSGFTITSGLAFGIDGASHRGALAAKGVTIGVAGTGLDRIYPASHRTLVNEIIDNNGAVISEFPLATPPLRMNFPRRNRIISGLSVGVLVVEAALRSGSLITAKLALNEGREVFAIPGSIHHPLARGCHYLIRQGAVLVEKAEDILAELSSFGAFFQPQNSSSQTNLRLLSQELSALLSHIDYEITTIDVILSRSGLTVGEVSSMLLSLELDGFIKSVTGGYVRLLDK